MRQLAATILVLACAILAIDCATAKDATIATVFDPCQPIVLVPDEGTTVAERQSLVVATELWRVRIGSRLTLDEMVGVPHVPVTFVAASPVGFGYYDDRVGHVYINRSLEDDHEREVTLAHEVGHAFGLVHIEGRESVMNKGNLSVEPNVDDAADVMAIWGACVAQL